MPRRSDCSRKMAARERGADDRSDRVALCHFTGCERIDQLAVAGNYLGNRVAGHVEYRAERANAHAPQSRHVFRALDRSRMQQPVATRAVGCDGECVASRIRQGYVVVLLDAEIATRGRLPIESRGQYTVLDRHSFRPAIHQNVKPASAPRRYEFAKLIHSQLDRWNDLPNATREKVRRSMLVETVHRVVCNNVAALPSELDDKSNVTRDDRQIESEPLVDDGAILDRKSVV